MALICLTPVSRPKSTTPIYEWSPNNLICFGFNSHNLANSMYSNIVHSSTYMSFMLIGLKFDKDSNVWMAVFLGQRRCSSVSAHLVLQTTKSFNYTLFAIVCVLPQPGGPIVNVAVCKYLMT